jgi:GNAT superfamily N-acetyltransferase
MTFPVLIRQATSGDRDFVFDAWRQSFFGGSGVRGYGDRDHYFTDMGAHIETKLGGSRVLVAHDQADPDLLVGFLAAEGPTLHYVYVRQRLRGHGIGLRMAATSMREAGEELKFFTHWPKGLRSPLWGLLYRPLWRRP